MGTITSARARAVTALVLVLGSFSLAAVTGTAEAAAGFKVSLNVSDMTPTAGQTVRFKGRVTPAAPGKQVQLQGRAAGTGWITIARPRLNRGSGYSASFAFPRAGNVSLRVVKLRSDGSAKGISRLRNLRVGGGSAASVILTESPLPSATVGAPYSTTIRTVDGRQGRFAAIDLPTGLAIGERSGVISGTPTQTGTTTFMVHFRDSNNRGVSKSFSLTVATAGAGRALPDITTTELPNGQAGVAYSMTLGVADNLAGAWSVTSGHLPDGLLLNSTTGVISGTPTTSGSNPVAFSVTFAETSTNFNDVQALSIRVAQAPGPVITTTSLPTGFSTGPYSATLQVSTTTAGTWSVSMGTLPAGLSLNASTGVISGTPTSNKTVPDVAEFTISYTQPGGILQSPRVDQQPLSITVDPNTAPVIANSSPPDGLVGRSFRDRLITSGDRSGTWAVTSGSLPAGLSLKSTTGEVTGVPGVAGTSTFVVTFTAINGLTDIEDFLILVRR